MLGLGRETMGMSFAEDRLDLPEFSQLLMTLLLEARQTLGVRALGIAELGVFDDHLRPSWRVWSGEPAPLGELTLEQFARLAGDETMTPEQSRYLGLEPALPAGSTQILPLAVAPEMTRGPNAVLVLVEGSTVPDTTLVSELRVCLQRGLSSDRLARLRSMLSAAVEQAADAIELTDRDARLFYVNEAWQRFTGHSAAQALGKTVGEVLRDPNAPLHDPAFYQFTMAELHAGRSWMGALAGRRRDGERIFSEVTVAPFVAEALGVRGHIALRRDLSHRSERDEALAMAHREFRSVLSAMPDGVAVLRDGRVYFANQAFTSMVREKEAGVIGRAYIDFIHPADRVQFEQEHKARVTRVRVLPAAGPPRFVEISTAGEVSFEGKPATILLSRDTTDYQLAREELSRAEKLSALGSLAASVAHEINNPLAYVAVNLGLVQKHALDALTAADREALAEAIEGVARMRNIAVELRTFSGTDDPGPPEAVDVSRALTSALNLAQNEIRHRARLVRDLEEGLFVLAREGQLVQVLVNVLVNAAQAIVAPNVEEQLIHVASRSTGRDSVEIVVTDTGSGIPEALLPHVFDPFSTSKRRGEGSGLGLAICKRIVQGFGGSIRIDSCVGKGTNVSIELPSTQRAPSQWPVGPPAVASSAAPRLRVLIIDDERALTRALRRVLNRHEVTIANDGAAGLQRLERDASFDVVLCDLMMPGLPGAQLYEEACRVRPELRSRFVFMTGGAVTPSSKEFLKSIDASVLWKPFDPAVAVQYVERAGRDPGHELEDNCPAIDAPSAAESTQRRLDNPTTTESS